MPTQEGRKFIKYARKGDTIRDTKNRIQLPTIIRDTKCPYFSKKKKKRITSYVI